MLGPRYPLPFDARPFAVLTATWKHGEAVLPGFEGLPAERFRLWGLGGAVTTRVFKCRRRLGYAVFEHGEAFQKCPMSVDTLGRLGIFFTL